MPLSSAMAGHRRAGLQAALDQLALERRAVLAPTTLGLCVLLGHGVHEEPGAHHPGTHDQAIVLSSASLAQRVLRPRLRPWRI